MFGEDQPDIRMFDPREPTIEEKMEMNEERNEMEFEEMKL